MDEFDRAIEDAVKNFTLDDMGPEDWSVIRRLQAPGLSEEERIKIITDHYKKEVEKILDECGSVPEIQVRDDYENE